MSGEPVTYLEWDEGQPDDSKPSQEGEDYAVLNRDVLTGHWNDWDHQRPEYFLIDGIAEFPIIPEPSTFILLGMGAVGLLAYAWRKRRRR